MEKIQHSRFEVLQNLNNATSNNTKRQNICNTYSVNLVKSVLDVDSEVFLHMRLRGVSLHMIGQTSMLCLYTWRIGTSGHSLQIAVS